MAKACLLGLALALAGCEDEDTDRPSQLILDNNGAAIVDVSIQSGSDATDFLESHALESFEVVTMWLSEDDLKEHPTLWVSTRSGGHVLIDLTPHRSQVDVYP